MHNGIWVSTCPAGFRENPITRTCTGCHPFCKRCFGLLSTECTEWDEDNEYYLAIPSTCQHSYCMPTTYFDSTKKVCKNCDPTCHNCIGAGPQQCVDCPVGSFLVNGNTCKTCTELDSSSYFNNSTETWHEVCGKGYNLGGVECDDGNTVDGDGCSSTCQVEYGYFCSGGNSTTSDTCKGNIGPECIIQPELTK